MGYKFFLAGGYPCGNSGDEAILKSTVYTLEELFPGSRFLIWADNREFNISFDRKINFVVLYWPALKILLGRRAIQKYFIKIYALFHPIPKLLALLFLRPPLPVRKAMEEADRVILVGGGYLNSYYELMQMNFICGLFKRLKKSVILLGQTLGPFNKATHARMACEIFKSARKIVLREEYSQLEMNGFRDKMILGVDDVVGFTPKITSEVQRILDAYFTPNDDGRKPFYLGLSLRPWQDSRKYYPAIGWALSEIYRQNPDLGLRILFIPMETSSLCDDRVEAAHLRPFCLPGVRIEVIREQIPVEAKFYLFSRLDFFVGMRLHGLIFSLLGGVPSVGLYYDEYYSRKIRGVLNVFGLHRNALPLAAIGRLPAIVSKILEKRDRVRTDLLKAKTSLVADRHSMLESLVLEGCR